MRDELRLLWVTPAVPRRGVSAAREYWWSLLRRLSRRHRMTVLAFADPSDDPATAELPSELDGIEVVERRPFRPEDPMALLPRTVAGAFADPRFTRALAMHLARPGAYDLVQYECVEMGNLLTPAPVPTILTVHQLGFAQEWAAWRAAGGGVRHGFVRLHRYLRALDFELRAMQRVNHVVTVSPEDADRVRRFLPDLPLSVSPVGVDATYFAPGASFGSAAATDLLFVGNFDHPPNADAVNFLLQAVLPRVGRALRVRIIGHGAEAAVGSARQSGVVEVLGPVADLRPHLAAARVVVAMVRFGTGMRGKVLEALAMARPVVTTAVGAEGLGATSGAELMIADDAASFAAALRMVLDAPEVGARLGAAGRGLVVKRFDWDRIAAAHEAIYQRVLGASPMSWVSDPGRWATVTPMARRLGCWPAIGVGAGILAGRGLRWHFGRRVRGAGVRTDRQLRGGAAAGAPSAERSESGVASTAGRTVCASVVICTRNRATIVGRAIAAALEQARAIGGEVIVVDNASTDGTPALLERLSHSHHDGALRIVGEPVLGLSVARNRGLALARGEVVAFLDDDAVPRPGWLAALCAGFASPGVWCAGGRIVARFSVAAPPWFCDDLAPAVSALDLGPVPRALRYGRAGDVYPYGANIAFRADAARAAGGFSTTVGLRGTELLAHEETDLCYRLEERGGEIRYVPAAVVDHWVSEERIAPAWFLARFHAGGRSAAAFVLRNRGILRALSRLAWLYGRPLRARPYAAGEVVDPKRFAAECRRREALGYVAGLIQGLRHYRRLRADRRGGAAFDAGRAAVGWVASPRL
jgi:glycosyltransferase involved in cell wall biosynthesis